MGHSFKHNVVSFSRANGAQKVKLICLFGKVLMELKLCHQENKTTMGSLYGFVIFFSFCLFQLRLAD